MTVGMIFVVERLGSVFEMSIFLSSATEGAILGLFVAGLFIPWIGKTGAFFGTCFSLSLMSGFIVTTQWYIYNGKIRYPNLPTSMDTCPYSLNATTKNFTITSSVILPDNGPPLIFQISLYYYALIGGVITIIVGLITSYFAGEMDISKVNPDHFSPMIRWYALIVHIKLIRFEVMTNIKNIID